MLPWSKLQVGRSDPTWPGTEDSPQPATSKEPKPSVQQSTGTKCCQQPQEPGSRSTPSPVFREDASPGQHLHCGLRAPEMRTQPFVQAPACRVPEGRWTVAWRRDRGALWRADRRSTDWSKRKGRHRGEWMLRELMSISCGERTTQQQLNPKGQFHAPSPINLAQRTTAPGEAAPHCSPVPCAISRALPSHRGRGIRIVRARVGARIGVMINMEAKDVAGRSGSLVNSLIASAMG